MQAGRYVIKQGNTLWGIAGRYYGNPVRWPEIYAYNNQPEIIAKTGQGIVNPGLIKAGWEIDLPRQRRRVALRGAPTAGPAPVASSASPAGPSPRPASSPVPAASPARATTTGASGHGQPAGGGNPVAQGQCPFAGHPVLGRSVEHRRTGPQGDAGLLNDGRDRLFAAKRLPETVLMP